MGQQTFEKGKPTLCFTIIIPVIHKSIADFNSLTYWEDWKNEIVPKCDDIGYSRL